MSDGAKYRAYIFDLDGTLTDSREAICHGVIHSLESIGVDGITPGEVIPWIGRPLIEIFPHFMRRAGVRREVDDELYRRLLASYLEGHNARFPDGVHIYPGVPETLERLRREGARLAIATTKHEDAALFVTEGVGLKALVDTVCGTDKDDPVKPDPFVLQKALDRLGVEPPDALAVGDTASDVLAARAAGCAAAAVTYGFGGEVELRAAGPDLWLERITEIP